MRQLLHTAVTPLCGLFLLTSCGDDPKLVAVSEKQKAEIARLRGEIALIEEKLRNMPPNLASELEAARIKSAQQKSEINQLESEITQLEAKKVSLEEEFKSYRLKYQLK